MIKAYVFFLWLEVTQVRKRQEFAGDVRSLIDLRHATLCLGIRLARNDFLIRRIFNEGLFNSFVTLVDDLDQELGCTRFLC